MSNQFLKLRRSSVPGKTPTTSSLEFGEIALNTYDGLAFIKKSGSFGEEIVTIGATSGSFTGSLFGTASWSLNSLTASYVNPLRQEVFITGSLNVTGSTLLVGPTSITGTTGSDGGQLGPELLSSAGWTSTGWTGTYGTGFTHTVGNTTALTNTLAAVNGNYYQIAYTVTSRTAGTFNITFGGITISNLSATGVSGPRATSTGTLSIAPTTDFDGTVVVSIKVISPSSASISLKNSSGSIVNEIRNDLSNTNTFIGLNAGSRNLSTSNTFVGSNSGQNNTSGGDNSFVGLNAGQNNNIGRQNSFFGVGAGSGNTVGDFNSFFGVGAGSSNSTGRLNVIIGVNAGASSNASNNTFVGVQSAFSITSGANNTALGFNAGRFAGAGSTANQTSSNSLYLGYQTRAGANGNTNEIVIGYDTVGLGSNTTIIGNSSTVTSAIYGNLLLGSTVSTGQRLQVTGDSLLKGSGNTSGTTALTVQNSDGNNFFRAVNDGSILLGTRPVTIGTTSNNTSVDINGRGILFSFNISGFQNVNAFNIQAGTIISEGTSQNGILNLNANFSPSLGSATFNTIQSTPTINQTGGANGTTRGLYINPTLTSAADWRSIEWSNNSGWGLYGAGRAPNYFSGSLSIGTTSTGSFTLDVSGSGRFTNGLTVTGSLNVGTITGSDALFTGTITAQRLAVQFITASTELVTGSTKFGTQLTNTHQFTGSVTITGSLGISGPITNVDWIQFNTSSASNNLPGKLVWNDNDGTLNLGMKGGNVTLQMGQEFLTRVHNLETITLTDGQLVAFSGSVGDKIGVKLANATFGQDASNIIGMVTEAILPGEEGFVTYRGFVRDLNTTLYLPGEMLYLDTVPGAYNNAPAEPPNASAAIGYAVIIDAVTGSIYVDIKAHLPLEGIDNVLDSTTTASYGDLLVKSGSVWASSKQLTGSYGLTGSLTLSGSLNATSSWAQNALTASYVNPLRQDVLITGSLNVTGSTLLVGPTSITGTTGSNNGQLGAELLSSAGWTSTGWTGDYNAGFTHTVGNTTALTNTLAAVNGNFYRISWTVTGRTAGTFVLTFGGYSSGNQSSTATVGPRASSTATLSITPTSDFDGTIVLSIRVITASSASVSLRNSSGIVTNEIRNDISNTNIFIGLNAGSRNISGSTNNTFVGSNAGLNNTTGTGNTFVGRNAGINNIIGSTNTFVGTDAGNAAIASIGNTFIGSSAGFSYRGNYSTFVGSNAGLLVTTGGSNTIFGADAGRSVTTGNSNSFFGESSGRNTTGNANNGFGRGSGYNNTSGNNNSWFGDGTGYDNTLGSNNSFFGAYAGIHNTTGSNNTGVGYAAGQYAGSGTTQNQISSASIYLGYQTRASASGDTNEIVIGYNVVGLGSNTTIIGNSSTVTTGIYGNLLLGSTVSTGERLQVTGTAKISGSTQITGSLSVLSGSFTVITGSGVEFEVAATGVKIGNLFTDVHTVTGSINLSGSLTLINQLNIESASLDYQQNLAVNNTAGWQTVVASPTASYKAAFFDYVAFSGSIGRAGTVTTFWSASATEFYENYTEDLGGSTSGVILQTAISASQIVLQATASSAAWTIRSLVRLL